MSKSLAEQYPEEQARCRELLAWYKEIGPAGAFGAAAIEQVLNEAEAAAARHDTVAMIRAFKRMQGCE